MASVQLTDEELFSQLKRFGVSPGPVTENTRPVYLKKLKKLREEQQQRGSRLSKTRCSGTSTTGSMASSGPVRHDVTRPSASRRPGRKCSVLGFSSDESDAEAPLKRKGLDPSGRPDRDPGERPDRSAGFPQGKPGTPLAGGRVPNSSSSPGPDGRRSGSLSWGVAGRSRRCGGDEEEAGNPRSVNGRGASRLNSSQLAGEFSDSEEEEAGGTGARDPERRRLEVRRSHPVGDQKGVYPGGRNSAVNPHGTGGMVGRDEEDEEAKPGKMDLRSHTVPRKSFHVSLLENQAGNSDKNHHLEGEDGALRSNDTKTWSAGLRPRFSGYSSPPGPPGPGCRDNHSNHTPAPNHSYSQLGKKKLSVPEDELLLQFKREELASSGSFSAHYLSMFLLTAACLFFLLLGLVYLRMRGSGPVDGVVKSHPFGSDFDSTYDAAEKDAILKLLLCLHDHLAVVAGQYDCGDQQRHPNRSLSIDEASSYLLAQNPEFKDFLHTSLEWIIRTDQDVGIRLTGPVADDPVTDVSDVSRLESSHPRMPFMCRFRRAFLTVMSKVLLVAVAAGLVWSVVCYVKYRWRREEEETRQMYDMVERIIDVMRTHGEACQENQDLQPYLPIPHVRDSLVQPQDRRKMRKVWERAVGFLSANESRIRTETQRMGGADFLVWRWIQPSLSGDKSSSMPSKVWQGKAFPLDRRNSPPNSLTPCLKIRNMFDPVMEVGENWDLAIQEAILEKCSDNDGIVHVAVDKNSREGCVYVKCLSAEHSGKAFKALHGSWFDGKLVTVKYLRLDRYHQRFPQAQSCSTPLKPSSLHPNSPSFPCQHHHVSANSSGFS